MPVVIGGGRVGTAISRMYPPHAAPVLGRNQRVSDADQGPIWVCTTNDALDSVISDTVPQGRRDDLIFIQNGMLLPWLRQHNLERNTQVLLYMAAGEDGSVTDGGLTLVHGGGKWAQHAAAVLAAGGVTCRVESEWGAYCDAAAAKLLWSCIFWVMSDALAKTVGEVASEDAADVDALVGELLPLVDAHLPPGSPCSGQGADTRDEPRALRRRGSGAPTTPRQQQEEDEEGWQQQRRQRVTAALLSYSLAISSARPSKQMALREWRWRNGWLLGQRRTPLHVAWLRRVGCSE